MALLPITLYGDKILRKKTEKIKEVSIKTIELVKSMFDTMKNANGIGIAANQVGADQSLFIVDISNVEGFEEIKPLIMLNPEITWFSPEKVLMEEGCLSIPDVRADVERPEGIKISFFDTDLKEQSVEADDLLARVIQHEFDHLNGVLFTDKISKDRRVIRNLHRIRNRKIDVDYPVAENSNYILNI